jgi:hypothetical protein
MTSSLALGMTKAITSTGGGKATVLFARLVGAVIVTVLPPIVTVAESSGSMMEPNAKGLGGRGDEKRGDGE